MDLWERQRPCAPTTMPPLLRAEESVQTMTKVHEFRGEVTARSMSCLSSISRAADGLDGYYACTTSKERCKQPPSPSLALSMVLLGDPAARSLRPHSASAFPEVGLATGTGTTLSSLSGTGYAMASSNYARLSNHRRQEPRRQYGITALMSFHGQATRQFSQFGSLGPTAM